MATSAKKKPVTLPVKNGLPSNHVTAPPSVPSSQTGPVSHTSPLGGSHYSTGSVTYIDSHKVKDLNPGNVPGGGPVQVQTSQEHDYGVGTPTPGSPGYGIYAAEQAYAAGSHQESFANAVSNNDIVVNPTGKLFGGFSENPNVYTTPQMIADALNANYAVQGLPSQDFITAGEATQYLPTGNVSTPGGKSSTPTSGSPSVGSSLLGSSETPATSGGNGSISPNVSAAPTIPASQSSVSTSGGTGIDPATGLPTSLESAIQNFGQTAAQPATSSSSTTATGNTPSAIDPYTGLPYSAENPYAGTEIATADTGMSSGGHGLLWWLMLGGLAVFGIVFHTKIEDWVHKHL